MRAKRKKVDWVNNWEEEIICPHCGYKHEDSWDYGMKYDGDEREVECGDCGKEFMASMSLDVSYHSGKFVEDEKGVSND